jgi:hypothetical protein
MSQEAGSLIEILKPLYSGSAVYGRHISRLLHALRYHGTLGLEQVRVCFASLPAILNTDIRSKGTGSIAQTIICMPRGGNRSLIPASIRILCRSSAGTITVKAITSGPSWERTFKLPYQVFGQYPPSGMVAITSPCFRSRLRSHDGNRDHTAWRILTKYLVRKFKGISDPDSEVSTSWRNRYVSQTSKFCQSVVISCSTRPNSSRKYSPLNLDPSADHQLERLR